MTSASTAAYQGFPTDWLQDVLCQQTGCKAPLAAASAGTFVMEGEAHCTGCSARHRIQRGILRLLDPARLDAESAHEREVRDEQAVEADYSWESTPATQTEMVPTMNASEPLQGAKVLELGAGPGRYSVRMAARGARLIAADFSFGALQSLAQRVEAGWQIGLIEADCTTLRVKPHAFDLVASTLMSNLPTKAHRQGLYEVAVSALRDGGRFVFSTHHFSWRARFKRLQRSGYYRDGGIYRYLFEPREIRQEVASYFGAVDCRPIEIHIPLAGKLGMQVMLSRLSERLWPVNRLGELLLVKATKPIRSAVRSVLAFIAASELLGEALLIAKESSMLF